MKLELRHGSRVHGVEVEPLAGGRARLRVKGPEGTPAETVVEVVSRTRHRWTLRVDGRIHDVIVSPTGDQTLVDWNNRTWELSVQDARRSRLARAAEGRTDGPVVLKAQMPGKVIRVLKREGEAVEEGEGLAVIEAMKMQNELRAPKSGRVAACRLEEGATVEAGAVLFEIE